MPLTGKGTLRMAEYMSFQAKKKSHYPIDTLTKCTAIFLIQEKKCLNTK